MANITVHRWIWAWDFDKEEEWLNDMAAQGWVLDGIGYCTYHFRSCEPGEYMVRLELLDGSIHMQKNREYITFLEETGVEVVGNWLKWVYFRKKTSEGGFDLFSDIDSRIRHLGRICRLFIILALANCSAALNAMTNRFAAPFSIFNMLCILMLAYGVMQIRKKKNALQRERFLRE